MPKLEIQSPDGQTELRRLSRRSPIVVGRNPISDVCVDEESVAPIHCRVSWNGSAFEVAAVAETGVDVNGVLVRRKELTSGDVIQVGNYRLAFRRSRDIVAAAAESTAAESAATNPPARGERRRRPEAPAESPRELNDDDWAALSGESAAEESTPAFMDARRSRSKRAEQAEHVETHREATGDDEPVLLDEVPKTPRPSEKPTPSPPAAAQTEKPVGTIGRLRHTKRPGDQDILTSPLVLGIGGLSLLLLLAAGTFWLLMDREAADRLYGAAVADREAGRYAQAIRNYEQFLLEFPTDDRGTDARFALGLTRIERYAGGSSPDFEKAQTAFESFVRGHRDLDGFDAQRDSLRKLARQMTAGASDSAVRTGDRKLLNSAEQARQSFDRYASSDGSVDDVRQELTNKINAATAAVRKREFFDAAAAKIDAAIAKNDFMAAFGTRSDLLTRYPDLAGDKRVRALLAKSLAAEKTLVKSVPPAVNEANAEGSTAPVALTLVGHTQARAGEVSDGRLVFAVARDSLVGLDAVTGRPRWRTSIGLDTPFFPVAVDASVPALIAFDATRNELMLLRREDGTPLWRTPVGGAASGPPLVAQGQIDLTTADGRLVRFALDTGEAVASLQFPQPVVGPAVLTGEGERLVVFGDQATAYTLDLRSLAVQAVSFTGQSAGSIDVPPQALGKMVLVCENDRLDSSVVRAFALDAESGTLSQVASERIDGLVRELPVARGNLLFVPSSLERITPLSVSDDAGQPPLTRLGAIQIPEGKDVSTFLVPGPDGMLWAAGSALRKLRLVAKGLELLPDSLAAGRHTQPPQASGESLFVARSLPSAPAVYVSQADREAMTGSWRTVLGAAIVAYASDDDAASLVTESGQAAIVSGDKATSGSFIDARSLSQWDEEAPEPLHGAMFDDGRAA
ncbi:MAG: PQQ-binding-like beta-propeller repeat protein, partial [Planctomycetaceae bacterium]